MKKNISNSPENIDIKPHRMGYEFNRETIPDYWMNDNVFVTTWMESLSILFPEGEQFFIDSVRHFREQITDKRLQKEISGFIGQEAMHSLEHVAMNNYLEEKGLPSAKMESHVVLLLNAMRKVLPKKDQLAITIALEHITALMADGLLEDNEHSTKNREEIAEGHMRDLWMWHAVEETEHKSVAFDVYETVDGNYARRVIYMLVATFGLGVMSSYFHVNLLRNTAKKGGLKDTLKGLNRIYGLNGYTTRLIPAWLSYFKPGFHPWDDDNSQLVAKWKEILLEAAPMTHLKAA